MKRKNHHHWIRVFLPICGLLSGTSWKSSYNLRKKIVVPGGRARQMHQDGFVFDIGPSWYWMPDVFEKFFSDFGKKPSDYYQLERLDPGYQVYFGKDDSMLIGDSLEKIYAEFEKVEAGSAKKLKTVYWKSRS